jgi:hypothetical protein
LLPQLPPDEVGAALLPLLSKRSTDADTFRTVLALIEDVLDRPLSDQLAEQLPVIAAQHGGEVRTVLSLLNRHGGTRHAGAVAELLDEKYPWYVQRDAVDALGEMRVDHFKLFKPLIATEHRYLRSSVLSVLSSKTKGAPEGGIVAYLRPVVALKGEDRSAVWAAMQLMASRISKDETAELVAVIRPMLGSSDREQREQAMQMLQRVAQGDIARHVAATQGFVTEWHLAGPFPSDRNNRGHHAAYPPERRVDLEAEYKGVNNLPVTWKSWRVTSVDGTAPLHKLMPLPVEYRTAYAVTRFDAPARQQVQVVVDADEGFKLWLNGGKVAEQFGRGSRAVLVPVREGRNELLIKVTNRKEWWQFSVKLLDPEGKALPWMLDATPVEAEDAEGD